MILELSEYLAMMMLYSSPVLYIYEVILYASLYGTSGDADPMLELQAVDMDEDESSGSPCDGSGCVGETLVASGGKTGRCGVEVAILVEPSDECALRKVFREVGDVADSVSSLRLVEPLPNTEGCILVFNDNFGLFDGDGDCSNGADVEGWL